MIEPLDINVLEHYLIFDDTEEIQIDEPYGFDAANFSIKQKDDGYGRDITFSGDDSAEYTFGLACNPLGHKLPKLLDYRNRKGFEANVKYKLKDTTLNLEYIAGQVDFEVSETNFYDYFNAVVVQDTKQAILKRKEGTKVDQFSSEGIDRNPIEPVQTTKLLLKSVPEIQESEWFVPTPTPIVTRNFVGNETPRFSAMFGLDKSQIKDSLSWIMDINTQPEDLRSINAKSDLTNITITFSEVTIRRLQGTGNLSLRYKIGADYNTAPTVNVVQYGASVDNWSGTIDISTIRNGESLWVYFQDDTTSAYSLVEHASGRMNAKVTSTAISSVSKGVRLIDAINYTAKSICKDFVVSAPRFEKGGEWYDNFILSGNMLRGRDKFVLEWETIHNYLQGSPNCDYEVKGSTLFIGKDEDFYTNNEMAVFELTPNDDLLGVFNERFLVNTLNFGYKNFNQEKDDSNTLDSVHTETEFSIANDQPKDSKDIEIDFIRDGSLGESTRRKAVAEKENSLSEDDKVFIYDVVPIASNTRESFFSLLNHYVNDDGNLQLLNDGTFNWSLLGFSLSDSVELKNTTNTGIYTVVEFTNTIITLQGNTPTSIGEILTEFDYPLTDVQFTIRTNEGFDLIEGISASSDYPNLYYTPKRDILNNWSRYIATTVLYNDKSIKCTYFKNAPEDTFNLRTRLTGGDIITENSDIEQSELKEPLLTANVFTTTVICDFSQFMDLSEKIRTVRGFIRVYNHNGKMWKIYPKEIEYSWKENKLEIIQAEEKYESGVTSLTYSDSRYFINEVGYDSEIVPQIEYTVDEEYIQLFDVFSRPLTTIIHFSQMSVSGNTFENTVDLSQAIEDLNT